MYEIRATAKFENIHECFMKMFCSNEGLIPTMCIVQGDIFQKILSFQVLVLHQEEGKLKRREKETREREKTKEKGREGKRERENEKQSMYKREKEKVEKRGPSISF